VKSDECKRNPDAGERVQRIISATGGRLEDSRGGTRLRDRTSRRRNDIGDRLVGEGSIIVRLQSLKGVEIVEGEGATPREKKRKASFIDRAGEAVTSILCVAHCKKVGGGPQ